MSVSTPRTLTAGDTWSWTASVADYPASAGWSMTCVFTNAEQRFSIDSTASGDEHLLAWTAAQSSAAVPGRYTWTAFAKLSGERYQVATGTTEVRPNVEGNRPFDARSDARIVYEQLVALWKAHSAGQGLAGAYTIAGRSMSFKSSADLLKELQFWRAQVDAEEAAERAAAGLDSGRKLHFRLER